MSVRSQRGRGLTGVPARHNVIVIGADDKYGKTGIPNGGKTTTTDVVRGASHALALAARFTHGPVLVSARLQHTTKADNNNNER